MGLIRQKQHSQLTLTWVLITLALGALIGIAAAAVFLAKDRSAQEDPDAPLFI